LKKSIESFFELLSPKPSNWTNWNLQWILWWLDRIRLSIEKKEGVENLQLVEDRNLNSYRVRCSKHDLIIHFKFDYEWMFWCWIID
jgi:hypothetical protein